MTLHAESLGRTRNRLGCKMPMSNFVIPEGQLILNEEERQYRARGLIYYVSTKSVKNYPVKIGRTTQGGPRLASLAASNRDALLNSTC